MPEKDPSPSPDLPEPDNRPPSSLAGKGIGGAVGLVKKSREKKRARIAARPVPVRLPPPPPTREQVLADLNRRYRHKLEIIEGLSISAEEKRDMKTREERDYLRQVQELMG